MSVFSAEWLALRESVDERARNGDVANAASARFTLRDHLDVVDLNAGTGANLRAAAPLLPARQNWLLVDRDDALRKAARRALCQWANTCAEEGEALVLTKGPARIRVAFATMDLARDLETVFQRAPGLITASAFFDLVPEDFIKRLARLCTEHKAALYATLTLNGVQRWTPHRPADNRIAAAFHRHQRSDKGLGPAAGPMAATLIADYFRVGGYSVIEGDSPWRLGGGDRMLISELVRGYAFAAAETGEVDDGTIEAWVKVNRSGAEIGHTDTFAAPS